MFKFTALFFSAILLFLTTSAYAAKISQVIAMKPKGDVASCVALLKKENEVYRKVVPKNHPSVRVVQATYAGDQTGMLWLVVEYDSLADMARIQSEAAGNKELAAVSQEAGESCSMVSQSLGEELYYHPGTK